MKRYLLALFLLLTSVVGRAEDFKVDGIKYEIISGPGYTVKVARGNSVSGNIVIPENVSYEGVTYRVTAIDFGAFTYSYNLTSISIPNSVIEVGDFAFADCGLERIFVDAGNPVYDSRERCNAIIETASNKLIRG
ncbi:MAG: leucine-rich repeat domain-containing protein, partial [Bacteroidaceae bacterium]|nr:leucine-rich repeat domain-containing protein [Bacteroidaceae bacterium]